MRLLTIAPIKHLIANNYKTKLGTAVPSLYQICVGRYPHATARYSTAYRPIRIMRKRSDLNIEIKLPYME